MEQASDTKAAIGAGAVPAFVALWGDMGSRWGVPRTMSQVHALLFMSEGPLNTDQIMERLSISRGNASMTLRTLVEWGMITRTHNPKDRKDYYAAEQDVWKLFATVARTRKRHEVEPLLGRLQALLDAAPTADAAQRRKIEEMLAFVKAFDGLANRFLGLGGGAIQTLARLLPGG